MRVVLATHAPRDPATAVYRHYLDRAAWLRDAGHDVELLTGQDVAPRFERSRWKPFAFPQRLASAIRAMTPAPDVVVGHSYSLWPLATGWHRWRFERQRPIGLVTEFHGLEPLYYRFCRESPMTASSISWRYRLYSERVLPTLLRRTCRASSAVLCTNREEEAFLVREGWAATGAVRLLPGVVDDSFFGAREFRPEAYRLLFLGQWLAPKGTAELVTAFEALAGRHEQLVLICLGVRTPAEQVLSGFRPEFRSRVRVIETASREEIATELAGADLFVLPSHYEGFGLALLEAMASALPIVTTAVGVAADALEHERDALVVPRGDPKALEEAIGRLLSDAPLRERLGTAAAVAAGTYRVEPWRRRFVELIEHVGATA